MGTPAPRGEAQLWGHLPAPSSCVVLSGMISRRWTWMVTFLFLCILQISN